MEQGQAVATEEQKTVESVLDELVPCGQEAKEHDAEHTEESFLDDNPPGKGPNDPPDPPDVALCAEVPVDEEPPEQPPDPPTASLTAVEDALYDRLAGRFNEEMNIALDQAKDALVKETTAKLDEIVAEAKRRVAAVSKDIDGAIAAGRKDAFDKTASLVGETRTIIKQCKEELAALGETSEKYKSHIKLAGDKLTAIGEKIEEWEKKSLFLAKFAKEMEEHGLTGEKFLGTLGSVKSTAEAASATATRIENANRRAFEDIWKELRDLKRGKADKAVATVAPAVEAKPQPKPEPQPPAPQPPKPADPPAQVPECEMCEKSPGKERTIKGEKMVLCDGCNASLSDESKPKEDRPAKVVKPVTDEGKGKGKPAKGKKH